MILNNLIDSDTVEKVKKKIAAASKIAITAHISPDGDAVGSTLALWHFLKALDKETTVVFPNRFPAFLSWVAGAKQSFNYEENPDLAKQIFKKADLIFALDFNTASRLEKMETLVTRAKAEKIMIDHHPFPDEFAKIRISHPEISSTSELVFRLIFQMGMLEKLNKDAADCIYMGMMTDTGNFSYNSSQPEIYLIISELLKFGIDKDEIYRRVHNNFSTGRMRLMGYALYKKMKIYRQFRTALITLTKAELEHFDFNSGDAEGFANIPLSIRGVKFSVFMREDVDKIKISLRSQGNFATNRMAAEVFGGGGHLNASGGESCTTMDETIKEFEDMLPLYAAELERK